MKRCRNLRGGFCGGFCVFSSILIGSKFDYFFIFFGVLFLKNDRIKFVFLGEVRWVRWKVRVCLFYYYVFCYC